MNDTSADTTGAMTQFEAVSRYYRARRERLGTNISERQGLALRAVPYLLHIHEKGLPGYRDGASTPYGIVVAPSDEAVEKRWREFFPATPLPEAAGETSIACVGMSGEGGTWGQGPETPFLFFVFAGDELADPALIALQWKCDQIAGWLDKNFHLRAEFHAMRPADLRAGVFPHVRRAKDAMDGPVIRDRLAATFFALAGAIPTFHAAGSEHSIDLGMPETIGHENLLHFALRRIEDLRERPSQASFPLANVLLALESGAFSPAEDVRASIHQNPEETDPFDLQFLHVESALAGRESTALRYLRQIAYIKINPGLSRVKADNPLTPAQRRMIKLVQDWGWKPLTLMSLDNITVWNYQQLLEFHHAFTDFCEWAVMVTRKAGDALDASAKPVDRGGLARTITTFRTLPGKISGVKPYSRLYYSSAQALFRQQNVVPGKLGWSVLVNVPMARDLDAPTTELTLRQDRFLLPLVLWMTRTGLISPKSLLNVEAAGARMPSKWAQELLDTCVALCKPPGAKAPPDAPRRDGVMFVLAANLNHEFAQDKERKPEPATASTRSGKGSISAPTVVGEAKVFDYEGTGTPVLQDFSLAYANPAGEVFSHHFDFRHHALARVFAFLASRLNYDEAAKKLNVDLLVPPNSQGMNIRLALQLTLFEMTKFFSGSSEHVRRFVTRQRGACYIFEKSPGDNEVRLQICKSVVDLLGRLENTQGMPTRVHIDKQVTGLERLRDLYAHAGVGKINLYVFRETAPHQIHLVDETGAFFSDRVPAETAFGQIGDMVAVLERYAERRGTSLAIFDVSRREGRMIDYVIEPATYADAIRAKRSSPFAIGLREAEPPDGKQHLITIGNATSTAELTADLIAKLSAAAKKAGGASVIDIPDRIEFAGGASVNVQSGARALRGAKAIRNMLLGS